MLRGERFVLEAVAVRVQARRREEEKEGQQGMP